MPRFEFAPKSCGRSRRYYCEIFGSFGAYFWVLIHCTIFWIINLILLFFLIYILVVLDYQTLIGKWIFMRFIAKLWVRYNSQCSYNILSWVWLAHDYNPSPWEAKAGVSYLRPGIWVKISLWLRLVTNSASILPEPGVLGLQMCTCTPDFYLNLSWGLSLGPQACLTKQVFHHWATSFVYVAEKKTELELL